MYLIRGDDGTVQYSAVIYVCTDRMSLLGADIPIFRSSNDIDSGNV